LPDESLFEAWQRYKLSIDRRPNHNTLPVTQIDTFYNELTLRHRDTINAATGGTFMKRRPEECYDLIENMTAHHNDWDTSAHKGESSSSSTSSSEIAALAQQMIEMRKDILHMRDLKVRCLATPLLTLERKSKQLPHGVVLPESTTRVLPSVVQPSPSSRSSKIPLFLSSSPFELPTWNPHQPPIPYLLRLNKEKLQDKYDIQVHKFLQMFKKLHFNISLAEALALIPKYAKILKDLVSNKEKLLGLANTSLTENYSAVPKLNSCHSLYGKINASKLIPTRMTLELANRSFAYLTGIAEVVCVQVGKFTFHTEFVVIDYDVDPRVPLILGRPFLRTARALVNVYGEELILKDDDEKSIFHADSTSKHPQKPGNYTTSPSNSSPSLTPFETSDSILEEFADELALLDPFPLGNEEDNFDPKADLREIKYFLNHDPSTNSSPTTDIDIVDPILERFNC
nr:reverse transcriptase domain-containing protein [Tanacetum cinerariifolium]